MSQAKLGMRIAVVSFAFLVLATPPSARAEDSTRIYVYAKYGTDARSWLPISCDGVVVAKLKHGTFFAVDVEPGKHVLNMARGGLPVFLDVLAGEETFVKIGWRKIGDAPAIPLLSVVGASHARREIVGTRYIDANKVLSTSVPKRDPRGPARLRRRDKTLDPTR